jgi:conjugative transfer signal peptidase TraF
MHCVKLSLVAKSHPMLSATAGFTVVMAVFSMLFADRQIVINTSPSVPPGLYVRSDHAPNVGQLVEFRIPEMAKAYVAAREGRVDRNWYILKPIAAGPGDVVDTRNDWLIINGKRVSPMPPACDKAGHPLPLWRQRRVLGSDEFFVFSARIPNSFDSRCYGPILRGQIAAVRKPIVTW